MSFTIVWKQLSHILFVFCLPLSAKRAVSIDWLKQEILPAADCQVMALMLSQAIALNISELPANHQLTVFDFIPEKVLLPQD